MNPLQHLAPTLNIICPFCPYCGAQLIMDNFNSHQFMCNNIIHPVTHIFNFNLNLDMYLSIKLPESIELFGARKSGMLCTVTVANSQHFKIFDVPYFDHTNIVDTLNTFIVRINNLKAFS